MRKPLLWAAALPPSQPAQLLLLLQLNRQKSENAGEAPPCHPGPHQIYQQISGMITVTKKLTSGCAHNLVRTGFPETPCYKGCDQKGKVEVLSPGLD